MITQSQTKKSKQVFETWTGISAGEHHRLIYQTGLKRLNVLAVPGSRYHRQLEFSNQFWTWWKTDWNAKNILVMQLSGIDPGKVPEPEEITCTKRRILLQKFRIVHQYIPITTPQKKTSHDHRSIHTLLS